MCSRSYTFRLDPLLYLKPFSVFSYCNRFIYFVIAKPVVGFCVHFLLSIKLRDYIILHSKCMSVTYVLNRKKKESESLSILMKQLSKMEYLNQGTRLKSNALFSFLFLNF